MAKGKLKIHSQNILPIIKKSLYSDKDIFIRELVSNSCDAISKLKVLREQGEVEFVDEDLKVEITLDKEAKTLTFADTGLGMDHDEVTNYIAQLAFSGAEEFMKKYEGGSEIIGHFGLGFYSAFMVSDQVDLKTLSYKKEAKPVDWSSDGSYDYTIDEGQKSKRGTEITLHVNEEEFLDAHRIKEILRKYCSYLPYPIFLNGERINDKEPLWLRSPSECKDEDYLAFFRALYPMDPDPIFWIHLNVDYPFNLKGILFFPKITKSFDFSRSHISLFCNRVFVSDNCKELLPEHLLILQGAIDSPDIPLNVSRSYLQMDRTVRSLGSHVSKKVSDRLHQLYTTDREAYEKAWPNIEMIIKMGCLREDKFYDRVKDLLLWETTDGKWTNAEDYLERNDYKKHLFYTNRGESHFLDLYKEKGIEVLISNTPLDSSVMSLLESKLPETKFQRIDGGIPDQILDPDKEKSVLDADGKSESTLIAEFVKKGLNDDKVEVEAKSLAGEGLPAFIAIDEQSRRMRDYMSLTQQELPKDLFGKRTFVVNTNSPLISAVYKLRETKPELAQEMVKQIFDLSLLGQRELGGDQVSEFIKRSTKLFEALI
ncbi:MAG: molecular chaperone HtpG [Simkaniaceae bacterium]|nr:molecular chaperone HtpG [Simkaniaceae bacterium]